MAKAQILFWVYSESDDEHKTAEPVPLDENEPEFLQDIYTYAVDILNTDY